MHAHESHAQKSDCFVPAGLIALSLVPAIAGIARVTEIVTGADVTISNARFLAQPLPVLLHIPAAIVFSILGALQFSSTFRRKRRGWHRAAGRILIPSGLLVAFTGLWMAHFYAWPEGDGYAVYLERIIVGVAMTASIMLGIHAIVRRDFHAHGNWMTRAYALGLGAGTQVLTHLPWFVLVDEKPGETARAVMMGAAWLINALIAEWVIRRQSPRLKRTLGQTRLLQGRHLVSDTTQ